MNTTSDECREAIQANTRALRDLIHQLRRAAQPANASEAAARALEVAHTVGSAGTETRPESLYFRTSPKGPRIYIPVSVNMSVSDAVDLARKAYTDAYSFGWRKPGGLWTEALAAVAPV